VLELGLHPNTELLAPITSSGATGQMVVFPPALPRRMTTKGHGYKGSRVCPQVELNLEGLPGGMKHSSLHKTSYRSPTKRDGEFEARAQPWCAPWAHLEPGS